MTWLVGTLFAMVAIAIGAQVVFADPLTGVAVPAELVVVVFLVAWPGVTVAGTIWTVRRFPGRRPRHR